MCGRRVPAVWWAGGVRSVLGPPAVRQWAVPPGMRRVVGGQLRAVHSRRGRRLHRPGRSERQLPDEQLRKRRGVRGGLVPRGLRSEQPRRLQAVHEQGRVAVLHGRRRLARFVPDGGLLQLRVRRRPRARGQLRRRRDALKQRLRVQRVRGGHDPGRRSFDQRVRAVCGR